MLTRENFTLFYSMPLDAQDWSNLKRSQVKQVMLPWGMVANNDHLLDTLKGMNIRVVLRLSDDDAKAHVGTLQAQLRDFMGRANIRAVVLGNEPESRFNFQWGADWHTEQAWVHANQVSDLMAAFNGVGPLLISPGWTMRGYLETDPPDPGTISWREICTPVYNRCDGNGAHLYAYTYSSQLDEVRILLALRRLGELRHKALWLDEVGVNEGNAAHRMGCYIRLATICASSHLGDRVVMFSPFVSNGVPDGWPEGYLLREPALYDSVATFMSEGSM